MNLITCSFFIRTKVFFAVKRMKQNRMIEIILPYVVRHGGCRCCILLLSLLQYNLNDDRYRYTTCLGRCF